MAYVYSIPYYTVQPCAQGGPWIFAHCSLATIQRIHQNVLEVRGSTDAKWFLPSYR